MSAATDRLEGASERLQESRKTLRETEAIGEDVMQDLRQQRETLLHARDGMREVDDNLDASRKVVRQMARRIQQNKRVMYFAGCFFVAMLLIVLVMKLKPDESERATPVPATTPRPIGTPPP
uniref:t-SNARE coiled-coil homology domain-containing protein n=1 Tax=Hemiselmis andersenii TaxID=464988 RepID=A0A7S1DXJ3_HEMAN